MKSELSTDLRNKVLQLNTLAENSQIALGMYLVKVDEEKLYEKWGFSEFHEYYQKELKRSKSDISKLKKVGKFILDNGFSEETEGLQVTPLYLSIGINKDADPKYVLSQAKTLSVAELRAEKAEAEPHEYEPVEVCSHCWKKDCPFKK